MRCSAAVTTSTPSQATPRLFIVPARYRWYAPGAAILHCNGDREGCPAEPRYAFEFRQKELDRERFRSADFVCTGTHAERDKRPDRYVGASVRDAEDDERFPLFTAAIRGARPTISTQCEPRYVESHTC